jgi:hypothetical protein
MESSQGGRARRSTAGKAPARADADAAAERSAPSGAAARKAPVRNKPPAGRKSKSVSSQLPPTAEPSPMQPDDAAAFAAFERADEAAAQRELASEDKTQKAQLAANWELIGASRSRGRASGSSRSRRSSPATAAVLARRRGAAAVRSGEVPRMLLSHIQFVSVYGSPYSSCRVIVMLAVWRRVHSRRLCVRAPQMP